ncbi:hypothetical protein [Nocardia australiensis]|uniref:hypothetical protein n=1 Tax=Nocardia australiensis TaxID=2887191 RepID=UPI001D13B62E|nr:hypothetical protein [Nocardia australiensis]
MNVQAPPDKRADATIIVDECHNFLHLPIGIDQALAEARGCRVSFVAIFEPYAVAVRVGYFRACFGGFAFIPPFQDHVR